MILIAWMAVALSTIFNGFMILRPDWFTKLTEKRYRCVSCHADITRKERFIAGFTAGESLEGREE